MTQLRAIKSVARRGIVDRCDSPSGVLGRSHA